MDGFPNTYFKVAPFAYDETVYDTDDLSITRGSSLTLLAMPELLKAHLPGAFPDLIFDWIQTSASELVFRATGPDTGSGVTFEPKKIARPKKVRADGWNKALQAKVDQCKGVLNDDALRRAADEILKEIPDTGFSVEDIAGQILKKYGRSFREPRPLNPEQCEQICIEIAAFTSGAQSGYPFDLMLYNAAWFQPTSAQIKPGDTIATLDTRLGRARFMRMGCIIPAVAKVGGLAADKAVCQFTGIYAAGATKEKTRPTSSSAHRRRKVGREKKTAFYDAVLTGAETAATAHDFTENPHVVEALAKIDEAKGKVGEFAGDFSAIVANPPGGLPASLRSNMCVLNMDGNGFGNLRGGPTDFKSYRRFSAYMDILKAGMLARILLWIADQANGMMDGGVARFETILWGGDEFTFVVPAWKGWELATEIHTAVENWQTLDGKEMTFATGLAFGPHKAPIRDLKNAAEDLATMAKSDKSQAIWQAVAYESVDRVHFSPEQYRGDWLGMQLKSKPFNIPAKDAVALPAMVKGILDATSRSTLHKLYYKHKDALACMAGDAEEISKQIDRIAPAMAEGALSVAKTALLPGGDYPLLRFAQINLLLDYIGFGERQT